MQEEIDTQREITARSSALFDGDLTIDEAVTQRKIIDLDEQYLHHVQNELLHHAEQGFLGYNHPGGLTLFFYAYEATPPAHTPGHYPR